MEIGDKIRAIRRIQMYWAVIKEANFPVDEGRLRKIRSLYAGNVKPLEPCFAQKIRQQVYKSNPPEQPKTLDEIVSELREFVNYQRENGVIKDSNGKNLFDKDDMAILDFLFPTSGKGPVMLAKYRIYHSAHADDFVKDILGYLDEG